MPSTPKNGQNSRDLRLVCVSCGGVTELAGTRSFKWGCLLCKQKETSNITNSPRHMEAHQIANVAVADQVQSVGDFVVCQRDVDNIIIAPCTLCWRRYTA
jgi:hypothetical protein